MKLGTYDGKKYTVPHTLDLSVWFWNKDLYKKAGLDPEKGPTNLQEFADQARTIRKKLGGKDYGTFFGGNCPGCYVFTFWPSVWAAGATVMGPRARSTTRAWRPRSRPTATSSARASPTRARRPSRGRRGPASSARATSASCRCPRRRSGLMPKDMDIGVTPIAGPDGSTVSMVTVVYREAFTQFDLGGAAALSVLLLIALVLLNVIQLRVLGRRDDR